MARPVTEKEAKESTKRGADGLTPWESLTKEWNKIGEAGMLGRL